MKNSDKPFAETIHQFLEEKDWSIRELSRRTVEETGWGSLAMVAALARGDFSPTMEAMEKMAKVLRTRPTVFAEYRLGKARAGLNPETVGLKKALNTLHRYEGS